MKGLTPVVRNIGEYDIAGSEILNMNGDRQICFGGSYKYSGPDGKSR